MLCQEISNRFLMAFHLAALATLAVAQEQFEPRPLRFEALRQAVRSFGAAETLDAAIRFEMSAKERTEHDQAIAAARAELGEEAFAAAFEEGKKMTLDEAIAYALEDNE